VAEYAEDLFPADQVLGEVYPFGWTSVSLSRCELAKGSVPVLLLGCKTGIKFIGSGPWHGWPAGAVGAVPAGRWSGRGTPNRPAGALPMHKRRSNRSSEIFTRR
jgi:hypothetical protein